MREYVSGVETDRAWHATVDGRYEEALRRWDAIVDRDLRIGSFNMNRGITRLLVGDLEGALADFLEWRNRPDRAKIPVPFVGATLWLLGRREAACEDLAWEISRRRAGEITHCDEAGGVEVPALLWWASARPGLDQWRGLAVEELRRRGRSKKCQRSRWPGSLVPFLLGKKPAETLIAAISYPSAFYARQICQAHFYIGASHLSRGELPLYQEQLALAAGEGGDAVTKPEYHLARLELRGAGSLSPPTG